MKKQLSNMTSIEKGVRMLSVKNIAKTALLVAMSFATTTLCGCGQGEAPITVEAEERYNPLLYSNVKTLTITSLVDSVTIKGYYSQ